MTSESQAIVALWDLVRDHVPQARRLEIAISFLREFEEYGFEKREMLDIVDEDPYLKRAFYDIFEEDEEEQDEDYDEYE